MKELEKKAKLSILNAMRKLADDAMAKKLEGAKKVVVASNSKEGLKTGLEKAKELLNIIPEKTEEDVELEGVSKELKKLDEKKSIFGDYEDAKEDKKVKSLTEELESSKESEETEEEVEEESKEAEQLKEEIISSLEDCSEEELKVIADKIKELKK